MKIALSHKKQAFLDYIQTYTIKNGEPPSYEEIMKALGFSSLGTVNWYVKTLTDEGYLLRSRGANGKRALVLTESNIASANLPLIGFVAAGEPIEALENPENVNVPAVFMKPDNFVLQVKGDSMIDDNIEDGDCIIVHKTPHAEQGDMVVALINGEATLKRYYANGSKIELHPRNPKYSIIKINQTDDFQINGVVLYSFRSY